MLNTRYLPATGMIQSTRTKLFFVPTAHTASIHDIIIVNTDSVSREIKLYINTDETPDTNIPVIPFPLTLGSKYRAQNIGPFLLGEGDFIEAETDADNVVFVAVFGEVNRATT